MVSQLFSYGCRCVVYSRTGENKRENWSKTTHNQVLPCSFWWRCVAIAGVAVLGGLVYAVGGFNGSLRVRTVDVYDPAKDSWSSVASMEARRSTLGAAVLNGCIYAIGGFDGSSGTIIIVIIIIQRCIVTWHLACHWLHGLMICTQLCIILIF